MKTIINSFIAVFALLMLGTTQQVMANNEPANEPTTAENPRLVECSYYTGTIGSNMKITMYLEYYSNGDYRGWYYYHSQGSNNKLIIRGYNDLDGAVRLSEYNKDNVLTADFRGSFKMNGEFSGKMYVHHSQKTYTFKLYPARY
jgi:hypothetical protein